MYICSVIEESHIPSKQEQGSLNQGTALKASVLCFNLEGTARVIEGKKVIFAVRSEDESKCKAIAQAIADVYNKWILGVHDYATAENNHIRTRGSWAPDLNQPDRAEEYVYVYATPSDPNSLRLSDVFYIGKGISGRWLAHVEEASDYREGEEMPDPWEIPKLIKINEALIKAGLAESDLPTKEAWARDYLIRRVASFTGDYRSEKSYAVENFLINYWVGVFHLTNKTRGDRGRRRIEWTSAPLPVVHTLPWRNVVSLFANGQKITQGPKIDLLKEELNSVFSARMWAPTTHNRSSANRISADANIIFDSDGTDAYFQLTVYKEGERYLLLDLKMGMKDLGARINIRPLPGDHQNFHQKIADVFFGGQIESARRYIKNRGSRAYFKACAVPGNGKNKKDIDTPFDLRNPASLRTLQCGAPILRGGAPRSATLDDALQMIMDLVDG